MVGETYSLSESIKNYEMFLTDTKNILKEISMDENSFPSTNNNIIWFKHHLREYKNSVESTLKELILEKTYYNQGLNHPDSYKNNNKL